MSSEGQSNSGNKEELLASVTSDDTPSNAPIQTLQLFAGTVIIDQILILKMIKGQWWMMLANQKSPNRSWIFFVI